MAFVASGNRHRPWVGPCALGNKRVMAIWMAELTLLEEAETEERDV